MAEPQSAYRNFNNFNVDHITEAKPVQQVGEVYKFYINFEDSFVPDDNEVNFADWKLGLINESNALTAIPDTDHNLFQNLLNGGPLFHVYGDFIAPNVTKGTYRLIIYDDVLNLVIYVGNCECLLLECADNATITIEYRNSVNYFRFFYEDIPADFYNTVRMQINVFNINTEKDGEPDRDESTGTRRNVDSILEKLYLFKAQHFDDKAHDAAEVMSEHDDIKLNGENYLTNEAWVRDYNPLVNRYSGQWRAYRVNFAQINRSCSLQNNQ